jgi:ATP-dependent RNA helicase DHX57
LWATERRRALAVEQAARAAAAEASRAETDAHDAATRTARAAAEIARAESRASNDSSLIAASERMRVALEARASETADPGFLKLLDQRRRLPAWAKTDELLRAVRTNQVTIVAGETGCGKTTQVPQFILDDAISRGEGARTSLICTQPRRISATSVARRVAQERGEPIGKTVGYAIRMESIVSSSTRILFVTTGVLLRRLAEDPLLAGVTHVVVDEVHERSLDSDFLLVLLRDVLPHRPTLRVVLMSATLNASAFKAYFKNAAVLQIPGFTFPVQEHYLEDILQVTAYAPSGEYLKRGHGGSAAPQSSRAPGEFQAPDAAAERTFLGELARRGYLESVRHALTSMDQSLINYDLSVRLIEHVCTRMDPGAILVFLPGLAEISKLRDMCASNQKIRDSTGGAKYLIGLHGSLDTSEQRMIFEHPPPGVRKIVIATNIAETSITIDDVVYVVDSGKCKENGYDPNTRMQLLVERWVSRASAKQRRGRAGRVAAGRCFRLYTRLYHDAGFAEHALPEIKRVPLEGLCLQIQLQKMAGGIAGFLGKALEPPKAESVTSAIKTLKRIGALNEKEHLTPLGQHLAVLPVDVRVGKMLLYGAVLGCLSPVLTIAAVLGGRSPFFAPLEKRDEADAAKRLFAEDQSDHLTSLNAYAAWVQAKALGKSVEMQFTRENFLSYRTLEGIADLRNQFAQLLQEVGFLGGGGKKRNFPGGRGKDKKGVPSPRGSHEGSRSQGSQGPNPGGKPWGRRGPPPDDPVWIRSNRNSENTRLIKAVLVAGLYPNLIKCTPSSKPGAPPRLTFLSEDGREEHVQVHPSSVNHGAKKYAARWLVYHERVQTTSVFVRDCSTVTPYQLLLFGGKIAVQHAAGTMSVDNWAEFKAPARVGVLLKEMRSGLERVLSDKIERPEEDLQAAGGSLVEAILQLLNTEPMTAAPS